MARSTFWFDRGELGALVRRLDEPVQAPSVAAPPAPARPPVADAGHPATMPPAPLAPATEPPEGGAAAAGAATLIDLVQSAALRRGNPEALAAQVAEAAAGALGAGRASVWLYEAASGWLKGVAGYRSREQRHEIPGYLPAEQFPAFFAALASRETLAAHHAADDPRTAELRARHVVDPELGSLLAVPLLQGDYLAGVLWVERAGSERRWTDEETRLAAAFAAVLGLGLSTAEHRRLAAERMTVERRLRRQGEALLLLSRSVRVGQPDAAPALREIAEVSAETLGVDRASVWLLSPLQTSLTCLDLFIRSGTTHEAGHELHAARLPAYFSALREERALAAHDARLDERTRELTDEHLGPAGVRSRLDAPVRVGERLLGVVCHEQVGEPRAWAPDEEHFASAIADLVALCLEGSARRQKESELEAAHARLDRGPAPPGATGGRESDAEPAIPG
jgi:GAF domain-containing protein